MLIHEMLEETAKRYPDKVAVKHEDETITFKELNEQSTKLAGFFYSKGVKEGDRIAIVAEKSIKSVVSIFGILKSGAMYVPIDPSIPKERLEYILKDCGVSMTVISPDSFTCYESVTPYNRTKNLWFDKYITLDFTDFIFIDSFEFLLEHKNPLNIEIGKDASAYIIYTSGSTGEPKGVEIYHRSVVNLMKWYTNEFNITINDKILSFVPFWFDASICDLFSVAKTGATLVIPPEGINMFPNEFAKFLVDEHISLFFAPSSQFVLAMDSLKQYVYPHMKTVMFGAEELAVKHVRELQKIFPQSGLVNIYGPTECTDVVTFYRVPKRIPKDIKKIPIGYSRPGVCVEILNGYGKICQINEIGELIVHGSNIMKGYWNKQKETENLLIPHNFPLGLWYRTNDLVYYNNKEGEIVYVGRKDRQIKSMGRRIQLEEVEHVLNEHPLIKEAVVEGVPDEKLEARINIECYVVPLPLVPTLVEGEIIRYCRTKLPDYMVPTKVYICDTLPKLSSGKLNRNIQK